MGIMAFLVTFRRQFRKLGLLQWVLISAIVMNLFIYLHLAQNKPETTGMIPDGSIRVSKPGSVTFLFREFEDFENAVEEMTSRAHNAYPEGDILVVSDYLPYPPIKLPSTAQIHVLQPTVNRSIPCLESLIQTEYIMILPDSCDIISWQGVHLVLKEFKTLPQHVRILAWSAFAMRDIQCLTLNANIRQWTLVYDHARRQEPFCDALKGNFVLLMRTSDFLKLSHPFLRPMGESLFIQTASKGWKVAFSNALTFRKINNLFEDGHNRWKHQLREVERQREMYKTLGVKYVLTADNTEEWYGCSKKSDRCFPTIIHDTPNYIYEGRWTPPCCLKALRTTARHVFTVLESEGVRYWLEGGSLLGAARIGDIIPWDYDVDIGIYREDIMKSRHLYRLHKNNFEDDQGFVWEKASEGDFYRVQFSQSNRLHVDIFPFDAKDGIMTKNTWIPGHKQDTEFPEHYLKPLEKLNFAGTVAFVPNNHKEFLELKFGEGVILNPVYPNMEKVKT